MTVIDFRADPAMARSYRVVSLVTHADIADIVWADDEAGCYGERGRDAKGKQKLSWSSLGRSGSSARGGDHARSSKCRALGEGHRLPTHARIRVFLENVVERQIPVIYQAPAGARSVMLLRDTRY